MPLLSRLYILVRRLDRERHALLAFAALYAASGVFHLLVWAIDGGAWAGDVSWRKPIVFGLSGAITTASLAWALGAVPRTRTRTREVQVYLATMTAEIGLITMQRWRGVGSHFNTATPFDAVVFSAMGALILVASVPIARWAYRVIRDRSLTLERRAAVGGGLGLLLVGIGVGVVIAQLGSFARITGDVALAETARGLVLAHAVGLHGIQVMLGLSVVLPMFVADPLRRARLLVRSALAVLAVLLTAAMVAA